MMPEQEVDAIPAASYSPRRRKIVVWLRIVVSAALLALLISRMDLGAIVILNRQRHASTIFWLVAAILMAAGGIVLSAWRWQRVLAIFDEHVPLRILVRHYFAGQFVGNVLPSTIGGDVLRVSRLTTNIGDGPTAFGSVVLERLTGFIALPMICLFGFAINPSLLGEKRSWIALLAAGLTLLALVFILTLAAHPKLAGRFREDEGWTRFIGAVHIGVERMRQQPKRAVAAIATAMLYQCSMVAVMWIIGRALEAHVPNGAVLAYFPAVAMAQVLPLSLSGLGVREGMLVLLLTPLGVSTGKALGIGLLYYLVMLVVSLPGAPSFAVGARRLKTDVGSS